MVKKTKTEIKTTHSKSITKTVSEHKPTKNSKTDLNINITVIPPKQNHKKKRGKMPDYLNLP
jgi:Holliday junction resolvase RusA-like endonuclease